MLYGTVSLQTCHNIPHLPQHWYGGSTVSPRDRMIQSQQNQTFMSQKFPIHVLNYTYSFFNVNSHGQSLNQKHFILASQRGGNSVFPLPPPIHNISDCFYKFSFPILSPRTILNRSISYCYRFCSQCLRPSSIQIPLAGNSLYHLLNQSQTYRVLK